MVGANVDATMDDSDPGHARQLIIIREGGELGEFTDEELLTVTLRISWRKS
jgi:hypothetical protein